MHSTAVEAVTTVPTHHHASFSVCLGTSGHEKMLKRRWAGAARVPPLLPGVGLPGDCCALTSPLAAASIK